MKISKTFLIVWLAIIAAFIIVLAVTACTEKEPASLGLPAFPLDTIIICDTINTIP